MKIIGNIWHYVFRLTDIGKAVDGKKTWIGLVLIVAGGLASMAADILAIFPQWVFLSTFIKALSEAAQAIAPYVEYLGLGTTAVGALDKIVKAVKKIQS